MRREVNLIEVKGQKSREEKKEMRGEKESREEKRREEKSRVE